MHNFKVYEIKQVMHRNKLIPGVPEIFLDCYLKSCRHNSFSSVTCEARNSRKNKHRLLSYSICLSFCSLFQSNSVTLKARYMRTNRHSFIPSLTYQTCYSRIGYFLNSLVYAEYKWPVSSWYCTSHTTCWTHSYNWWCWGFIHRNRSIHSLFAMSSL